MSFPDPRHVEPRYRKYGFAIVGLMMLIILCYGTVMSVIIMQSNPPIEYSETQEWTTLPDLTICSQQCDWTQTQVDILPNTSTVERFSVQQPVNSFMMTVFPKKGESFDVPARMTLVPGHSLFRAGACHVPQRCATAQLSNVSLKMDSWNAMLFSVGIRFAAPSWNPRGKNGCQVLYLETPNKMGLLGYMRPYHTDKSRTPLVVSLEQSTWKHKSITPWGDTPQHRFKGVTMGAGALKTGMPFYVIDNITDPQRPYRFRKSKFGFDVLDWPIARGGNFFDEMCTVWFFNNKETVTTITTVGRDYQIFRMLGSLGGFVTIIGFAFAVCFEKKYPHSREVRMNEAMTLRGMVTETEDYVEGDEEYEDSEEEAP